MRARLLAGFAVVVLTFAGAMACGDDGGNSEQDDLQDYFVDIEETFQTAHDQSEADEASFETELSAAQTLDEQIAAYDLYVARVLSNFSAAIRDMDNADSPAQVAADHDQFLQAINDATTAALEFRTTVGAAVDELSAQAAVTDFEGALGGITASRDEACTNLQAAADAATIEVDLLCE